MNDPSFGTRFVLPTEVEAERVHAVNQLYLLDSPPEDRFARVTSMARCALGVPMAAVSLIAADRQWFKQADGLNLDGSIPREQTICQATIARTYDDDLDPLLVIEDTRRSEFAELPAIRTEGGIRFYAGYPLRGPGGHAVGTLCVYDTRPRTLDAGQRRTFVELAGWAERELHSSDDLERAAAVQRQLLPPPLADLPGYTVHALCIPAFAVGGDFYDHYQVPGGVVFTIADVMGKGLAAAILTATVRSALRGASRAVDRSGADADIADAVNAVAQQISDDLSGTDSFVTMVHLMLRPEDGLLDYVDAGHGFAAHIRRDGSVTQLRGNGLPLGVSPDEIWTSRRVHLAPGEGVVLASDGVLDLISDGCDVGPALRFVAEHADPAELCAQIHALSAARPALDDVTLVALRREPLP